jgi:molybdopterin molybdotransferase
MALFRGLEGGEGQAYRINVPHQGATYAAMPFRLPLTGGYDVTIRRLDTTTSIERVVMLGAAASVELGEERLKIVEQIYTGRPPSTPITPGTCAEIATGAPLPVGADAVVMVEQTTSAGDELVAIHAAALAGQNIGRQGADIAAHATVLRTGELLNPGRIGAVAAIGCVELDVYAKPRVAILSTGNEVVEPGVALAPGQIFDVNRFTLA